jgi:hypothetical protein
MKFSNKIKTFFVLFLVSFPLINADSPDYSLTARREMERHPMQSHSNSRAGYHPGYSAGAGYHPAGAEGRAAERGFQYGEGVGAGAADTGGVYIDPNQYPTQNQTQPNINIYNSPYAK